MSRKVLYLWVRTKVFPQDLSSKSQSRSAGVLRCCRHGSCHHCWCWKTETRARNCRALSRMKGGALKEDRSFFFLSDARRKPTLLQRNRFETSPRLKRLMEAVQATPGLDVQLVPVTIL